MLYLKETQTLHPSSKVIKAADYALLAEREQIIAQAHSQAAEIIAQAKAAFEAERTKGLAQGLDEGKAQIAEHMLVTIANTVNNLETFEAQVVDIVMKALNRIIGEMDDKERITRVVRQSLLLVRNQKRVTIKANPSDARILEAETASILQNYNGISYIDIVADARIPIGSCMLETDIGVVDARLDVQIEAIHRSLTKSLK